MPAAFVVCNWSCVYLLERKCFHFQYILRDIDSHKIRQCFYNLHLRHMYGHSVHIRRCLKKSDYAIQVQWFLVLQL